MLPLNQAFSIVDQVVTNLDFKLTSEEILTTNSINRILATPQFSRLNLPPFDKSAMDGIAILASDAYKKKEEYKLLETVAAGNLPKQKLQSGTTMKIMTGAPIPKGASVIVPVEMIKIDNDIVKIIEWPNSNNICKLGEDLKIDDMILTAGRILNPVAIANLIACGITTIPVYRKLKAAIISTGEEVVNDFKNITTGKIMDSNGPMLQTLCNKKGIETIVNLKPNATYETLVKTLKTFLTKTDLILLSGGVSAGDFDFVASALTAAGLTTHFNRVAIKPGKPITFASSDKTLVFALPGNPISVYLTFCLFVLRAIRKLFNTTNEEKNLLTLPLAKEFKRKRVERTEYVPCQLVSNGTLIPLNYHGSAHLAILLKSDGFFVVPKDINNITQGTRVSFLKLI